jgi:hypothetical protein
VIRVSRIQRLGGLLSVLTASSCIWPQPVNEEPPPPTPTDVAPTITFLDPGSGPIPATSPNPGECQVGVRQVKAVSPINRKLYVRCYLNYLNLPAVNDNPILDLPMQGATEGEQTFNAQKFPLTDLQNRLNHDGPNSFWVWVSDGFQNTPCPDFPAECDPTPKPGYYSTSFSWTIDFSACPNFPSP